MRKNNIQTKQLQYMYKNKRERDIIKMIFLYQYCMKIKFQTFHNM